MEFSSLHHWTINTALWWNAVWIWLLILVKGDFDCDILLQLGRRQIDFSSFLISYHWNHLYCGVGSRQHHSGLVGSWSNHNFWTDFKLRFSDPLGVGSQTLTGPIDILLDGATNYIDRGADTSISGTGSSPQFETLQWHNLDNLDNTRLEAPDSQPRILSPHCGVGSRNSNTGLVTIPGWFGWQHYNHPEVFWLATTPLFLRGWLPITTLTGLEVSLFFFDIVSYIWFEFLLQHSLLFPGANVANNSARSGVGSRFYLSGPVEQYKQGVGALTERPNTGFSADPTIRYIAVPAVSPQIDQHSTRQFALHFHPAFAETLSSSCFWWLSRQDYSSWLNWGWAPHNWLALDIIQFQNFPRWFFISLVCTFILHIAFQLFWHRAFGTIHNSFSGKHPCWLVWPLGPFSGRWISEPRTKRGHQLSGGHTGTGSNAPTTWKPPFGGKSGPKSRPSTAFGRRTRSLTLLIFALIMTNIMQHWRSEGCGSAMGATGVPTDSTPVLIRGTKQHGRRPTMCDSTSMRLETATQERSRVEKRSLKRAYMRSLHQGVAWYKGKQYVPAEFERMGCAHTSPPDLTKALSTHLQRDWQRCNHHHAAKRRLTIWQWNCGGISAARLDEVKAWLVLNHVTIAVLVETRLTYDAFWTDPHWHCLHTGEGPHRGKGIMILISTSLCTAADISWQFPDSGRLAHVRLTGPTRPIDIVACYQHTFQANTACHKARSQWWTQLEQVLTGIPNRHNLILLGDFNCSVDASPNNTGTQVFAWHGQDITGPAHPDQFRFLQLLRQFSLVVLNSWSATLGPTYVHGQKASRIDHICVRQMYADGEARNVSYLWQSPFLEQTDVGHVPMMCTIAKYWIPAFERHKIQTVTMQQRRESRQAYVDQTPTWQRFT